MTTVLVPDAPVAAEPGRDSASEAPTCKGGKRLGARAFTIMEILIVLVILGMLVGVLMSGITKNFASAKTQITKLMITQTLHSALIRYNIDMGNYPTTEEGLAALVKAPADKADQWKGPYYEAPGGKPLLDPWNREYKYVCPGVHNKDSYDLWSTGPDGVDNTADDIGNW